IEGPGVDIAPSLGPPLKGARTQATRVLNQTFSNNRLIVTLEGQAGDEFRIPLNVTWHLQKLQVSGAELQSARTHDQRSTNAPTQVLTGHSPPGSGYQILTVTLTW